MKASRLLASAGLHAATNREAIIDVTEALLVEGGLPAVTVEAVAERAVEENWRYMAPAFESDGEPVDRLAAVAGAYISFARERPRQFELLNTPPNEPVAMERIAAKVDGQIGALAEILKAGIADGSFVTDAQPVVAATALWAMMEGVLVLEWRRDPYTRGFRSDGVPDQLCVRNDRQRAEAAVAGAVADLIRKPLRSGRVACFQSFSGVPRDKTPGRRKIPVHG